MNWGRFVRHNRWQKLTAFLLAVLIWLTVARKLRNGGGVHLTFDGSSRIFDGVPVHLLTADGSIGRCQLIPANVAVTLRGDPGVGRGPMKMTSTPIERIPEEMAFSIM